MQDDLQNLDAVLETAPDKTLVEIVRQAEKFLESQLQAGVAADQRAVTLASVVAALASALIAGFAFALVETSTKLLAFGTVLLPMIFFLIVAVGLAAYTCRPVDWCYPGNSPRFWRADIEGKMKFNESIAGQAKLYAKGISENNKILNQNARVMTYALGAAGGALVVGLLAILWLMVTQLTG